MSKYPFAYTVVIFDEYDDVNHRNVFLRESGMGLAESYADAMKYIEEYYDTDLSSVIYLELFEENNLILFPNEVIQNYVKADGYYGEAVSCDAFGNPFDKEGSN